MTITRGMCGHSEGTGDKDVEKNHILIVEDDKEIRDGIEIYLKSQGYEVYKAADGIEGLEVGAAKRYI